MVYTFSIPIFVPSMLFLTIFLAFFAAILVYWSVKFVLSIITGG